MAAASSGRQGNKAKRLISGTFQGQDYRGMGAAQMTSICDIRALEFA